MSPSGLGEYFGPAGAFSSDGGPFAFRKEQLAYAAGVKELIESNSVGMIEGGTGVGKTLGYLVPHILEAKKNGKRILVATRTKNLQDQIFINDLPRLAKTFDFTYALLKGRENYVCRERLEDAIIDNELFAQTDRGRALKYMSAFDRLHKTGDIEASLDFMKRYGADGQRVINDIRATDETCVSDHKSSCRHYKALAAAEKVDLIVANHHLALYWPETYPVVDHVVIDEAHSLEEAATDVLGMKFTVLLIHSRLRRLHSKDRSRGILGRFKRTEWAEFEIDGIVTRIEEIRIRANHFEEICASLGNDRSTITAEFQGGEAWKAICDSAALLASSVGIIALALRKLSSSLSEIERFQSLREKISKSSLGLLELSSAITNIFTMTPPEGEVLWYEKPRTRPIMVRRSPLNVAEKLKAHFYNRFRSVLLTSATLQVAGGFDFLSKRLGLEGERLFLPRSVGHPFDYSSAVLLCLIREQARVEPSEIAARISKIAKLSQGRMLGLFTNKKRMLDIADQLVVDDIDIIVQYRDGSRHDLAKRLRTTPRSILMGTRSFWEGIDVPGENLTVVVMEKIPFTSPGEPVYEARCQAEGAKWFINYALPIALLTLRQGFGRLIRTEEDRGVVVILDPGRTSYRKQILATLPDCRTVDGGEEEVLAAIGEFLA